MFMPPVQSQSTVGQSNESLRIHPLLHCCNCTTTEQHVSRGSLRIFHQGIHWSSHLLPLAIRVECDTVDWTEMSLDPSELLFVGSMEEPEDRDKTWVII